MTNSVTGSSIETRTLEYFDRLPRSVRAVVSSARFDWSLKAWLNRFERGEVSAKELAATIASVDATQAAKERLRIWGPDYPILKGELPAPRPKPQQRRRKR